jgi:hypothetical protein
LVLTVQKADPQLAQAARAGTGKAGRSANMHSTIPTASRSRLGSVQGCADARVTASGLISGKAIGAPLPEISWKKYRICRARQNR